METRALLYFIAVAEEKNMGRAASRLHMTQPALTRQIHSLEEEIGVPLFTRTTTGMDITAAGTALLRHARTIQAEIEQAKTNAMQANGDQCQQLDIGVYGTALFDTIPKILSAFSHAHPNVEFHLHNIRKDQQIDFLRKGKIQIAFDRYLPQEPDLAYELVLREHMCVVLHRDHPLAKQDVINMDELKDEPRIGANFDRIMANNLSQVFGQVPKVSHRADDSLTALALVSCGFGITFAPSSIQALQLPNVVYRSYVGNPKVPIDVHCMYRKDNLSPLLHAMLETIRVFRDSQQR